MNRTSVQLADGSGDYAASLGKSAWPVYLWASLIEVDVYHHLHCLVRYQKESICKKVCSTSTRNTSAITFTLSITPWNFTTSRRRNMSVSFPLSVVSILQLMSIRPLPWCHPPRAHVSGGGDNDHLRLGSQKDIPATASLLRARMCQFRSHRQLGQIAIFWHHRSEIHRPSHAG